MKENMKKVMKAGVALSMALNVTPTSLYAQDQTTADETTDTTTIPTQGQQDATDVVEGMTNTTPSTEDTNTVPSETPPQEDPDEGEITQQGNITPEQTTPQKKQQQYNINKETTTSKEETKEQPVADPSTGAIEGEDYKVQNSYVHVYTEKGLRYAVENYNTYGKSIWLKPNNLDQDGSITLTQSIIINNSTQIEILFGQTNNSIIGPAVGSAFVVQSEAGLKLNNSKGKNATVIASNSASPLIDSYGATDFYGVTLQGSSDATLGCAPLLSINTQIQQQFTGMSMITNGDVIGVTEGVSANIIAYGSDSGKSNDWKAQGNVLKVGNNASIDANFQGNTLVQGEISVGEGATGNVLGLATFKKPDGTANEDVNQLLPEGRQIGQDGTIEEVQTKAFTVETENKDGYTYENGILTFTKSGDYKVIGDGKQTSDRIIVKESFEGTITINHLNIVGDYYSPIDIVPSAKVKIVLEGDNTLISNNINAAAIHFGSNDEISGHLIVDAKEGGALTVKADYGAGIGGSQGEKSNNITINDGHIIASTNKAPGIGNGGWAEQNTEGKFIIDGGIIETSNKDHPAYSLGGCNSSVYINDGIVKGNIEGSLFINGGSYIGDILGLANINGGSIEGKITEEQGFPYGNNKHVLKITNGNYKGNVQGNVIIDGGYANIQSITGTITNSSGQTLKMVELENTLDEISSLYIGNDNNTLTDQKISKPIKDNPFYVFVSEGKHTVKVKDSNNNERDYIINVKGEDIDVTLDAQAQIGDVQYKTLSEAFEKVKDNQTISLVSDVEITQNIDINTDKKYTLDLNGHTLTNNIKSQIVALSFYFGNVTLTNSQEKGSIILNAPQTSVVVQKGVTLNLENIKVVGKYENESIVMLV